MQINVAWYCTGSIDFRFAPIMKLSLNTFDKRKTAVMVLLAWLFALVSGIANACLLEMPATHAHAGTASFEGEYVSATIDHDIGTNADDESPTAKTPCLKVCDESTNAVATQLSRAQIDVAPAPLVKVLWRLVAADQVAPFETGDPGPTTPELPLRVRYSRLAL